MEVQAHYTRETRLNNTLLKELLLIQIALEEFKDNRPIYLEQTEDLIQSIDQLLEKVIECEWQCEP
ncbi:MAG: hypothetical protein AB8B56_09530 [Crocinitomicaceae bacterium]